MCCPQAARAFLCLGLPGKQLMPVLGRCPSRTPGWGGRTAVCPSSRRREKRGESTALIHSWDPSAWLCALCSASFCPPAVSSSVSPLQCPCRVQSMSSRRTPAPAREAVVLPALGTPRARLLHHSCQTVGTALALPWLAPVECCNLPVDGSFGATCRIPSPCSPARRRANPTPAEAGLARTACLGQGSLDTARSSHETQRTWSLFLQHRIDRPAVCSGHTSPWPVDAVRTRGVGPDVALKTRLSKTEARGDSGRLGKGPGK